MPLSPVLRTLSELVRINSVNSFYESGPGEAELAAWVRRYFQDRHFETWEQEVFPGRSNVIIRLPGRRSTHRLILEAHMDTVSVQGMAIPPFEPRLEGGKLYGRGSCDTKAGLAAMMEAVASLKAEGAVPPCEVWLAAVVDEEYSYRGVVKLCEGLSARAAIVAEPTELRAVIASKGVLRWRIVVKGKAAHSSKPHLGRNAVVDMAKLIVELENDHASLIAKQHPLLGPATCNIGVINGGVQVNFVPDLCAIELDRRLLPGERAEGVLAHYHRLIGEIEIRIPGLKAEIEPPMLVDEALDTPHEAPVAQAAAAVLSSLGLNGELCGVPYGSDASKLSRAGIPSIVFGPGSIDQAHAAVEYVEIDQVETAVEFYRKFLMAFEPDMQS